MNSVVGSSAGTRGALSRIRCSRRWKCCRKRWRISGPVKELRKFTGHLAKLSLPLPRIRACGEGLSRTHTPALLVLRPHQGPSVGILFLCGFGGDLFAEVFESGPLEAGYVHLADAETLGDLRLGHL